MQVTVGGKTINIENEHFPEADILISICERLTKQLYLATLLCKGNEIEGDGGTLEYKKSLLISDVISDLYFSVGRASFTVLKFQKLGAESLIHAIPIIRGIIETCVNAAFIIAKGDSEAERAIEHAIARSYVGFEKSTGKGEHINKCVNT